MSVNRTNKTGQQTKSPLMQANKHRPAPPLSGRITARLRDLARAGAADDAGRVRHTHCVDRVRFPAEPDLPHDHDRVSREPLVDHAADPRRPHLLSPGKTLRPPGSGRALSSSLIYLRICVKIYIKSLRSRSPETFCQISKLRILHEIVAGDPF